MDLVYRNPFTYDERPDAKTVVMDIKATLSSGEWLNLEMQVGKLGVIYINRSVYYEAKLLTEQLDAGENYGILKPTIVISIVSETLFPNWEDAHSQFRYRELKYGADLTDLCEMHYLELGKIGDEKPAAELSPLERFGAYVKYEADPSHAEYVQEILRCEEEVIDMVDAMLKKVSADERTREMHRARELFLLDERTMMYMARKEGREEGREEGEAAAMERMSRLAKHLNAEGRSDDLIRAAQDPVYQRELLKEYNL